MSKTCRQCNRPIPPAYLDCPHCNNRRKAVLFVAIAAAVLLVFLAVVFFPRSESKQSSLSRRAAPKAQAGKEWRRPEGDAGQLAASMSVSELLAAWEVVPTDRTLWAMHAEYAKALGRKGPEAADAVPSLAPFVTHQDLYLRQGAMEGLAGIGEEGLGHLVRALKYKKPGDAEAVNIRWDAATAIGKMGPQAAGAEQDLLGRLTDIQENTNVQLDAAAALANIGTETVDSLQTARCFFYSQDGLSPGQEGVLRTINIALQNMGAAMEPCQSAEQEQQPAADTEEQPAADSQQE